MCFQRLKWGSSSFSCSSDGGIPPSALFFSIAVLYSASKTEEVKYLIPSLLFQCNHSQIIAVDFLSCFLLCRLEGPALGCSANPKEIVTEHRCVSGPFLQVQLRVVAASRNSVAEISSKMGNPVGRKKICPFLVILNKVDFIYI